MVAEVLTGLGSLKTLKDIAKGLKSINDATVRNAAIIDLQETILAAQMEQSALIEQVGQLEKEVTRLKEWDADKKRYALGEVAPGAFAYVLKRSKANGEPTHALCANCYERGEKAHLHNNGNPVIYDNALVCHKCRSQIKTGGSSKKLPEID